MSADDVSNPAVAAVSVGPLIELEFDMQSTDERSDANSETSQCGYSYYKYSWNVTRPIKLADWN